MTTTTTDAVSIPAISRAEAPALAEEEYRRWAEAIAALDDAGWDNPTDCEGWTVRDMAGHVLGAMRSAASVRELMSQQREIKKRVAATGTNQVDVMTAVQIERTAGLSPAELCAETADLVGPAATGRRRTPGLLRRVVRIPVEIGSIAETWTLGYLLDTILTRDIVMHRIDLARATGGQADLGGAHGQRVVAEIVGEWARRHGEDVDLTLIGDGGGHFIVGDGGETIEIDTVEFLRVLSGRGQGTGLLAQEVPF